MKEAKGLFLLGATLSRRDIAHGRKRSRADRTNSSKRKKRLKPWLANQIVMTVFGTFPIGPWYYWFL